MSSIRLQKYLASKGVASRRKCEEFIAAGMVKVNGEIVTEMGTKVDPEKDEIEVDGARLEEHKEQLVYVKLNKPKGYECTVNPPEGSKSVLELVNTKERVFTVGRLDKESEGLLLLTNDGVLTYKLTHPKFEKGKAYEVTVDKPIKDSDLETMAGGVSILKRKTAPATVERLSSRKFRITITEGMNRQVRRMCRRFDLRVHKLKRVSVGEIQLGDLETGEWKYLDQDEMKYIREILKADTSN